MRLERKDASLAFRYLSQFPSVVPDPGIQRTMPKSFKGEAEEKSAKGGEEVGTPLAKTKRGGF